MELIFNEISLHDKPNNAYQAKVILENFAKTCSSFKKEGFNKLRVESDFWANIYFNSIRLNDFLQQIPSQTQKSFLRSFVRKPYIADDFLSDTDEKYAQNEYLYKTDKVTGLAYAYLLDTIAISLLTNLEWESTDISIIEKNNMSVTEVSVKNASKPEHITIHENWINNQKTVTLIKTNKNPEEKRITLFGDHHGKKHLQTLAGKLIRSPYVEEIKSTNFGGNSFIRKIYPNGILEIVEMSKDEKFALWVKTTGRNLKETTEIAKILENNYK